MFFKSEDSLTFCEEVYAVCEPGIAVSCTKLEGTLLKENSLLYEWVHKTD